MAHHFADNVHTKSFTPREYQVELLDAAKDRNIIECLATESGKSFIAMKLIQEMANDTRRKFGRRKDGGRGGKRTLFLVEQKKKACKVSLGLRNLTDLSVSNMWYKEVDSRSWSNERWKQELQLHQVLVMSSQMCYFILSRGILSLKYVNLLIMDQCHRAIKDHPYAKIMYDFYKKLPRKKRPRILGLTTPLLLLMGCPVTEKDIPLKAPHPGYLEAHLERLEKILDCTAETASDIVSLLRYCPRPRELVIEWSLARGCDPEAISLSRRIELELTTAWNFLQDHRYDPMEIYQDAEFAEELSRIPDPKIDPVNVLKDFVHILKTLGPWCADRAALLMLIHLDKLKVKTPYERHFLLLCMVTTIMVKIRRICDLAFQDYDERERIYKFSTPKVLRFLEILKEFLPPVTSSTKDTESQVLSKEGIESIEEREVSKRETNQSNEEKDGSLNEKNLTDDDKTMQQNKSSSGEVNEKTEEQLDEIDSEIHDLNEVNEELCAPSNIAVGNDDVPDEICSKIENNNSPFEKNINSEKTENDLILDNISDCVDKENHSTEKGLQGNLNECLPTVIEPARFANKGSPVWERGVGRGRKWGGYRSRGRGARAGGRVGHMPFNKSGPDLSVSDSLCGIVFVDGRFTAKILYHLLNDLRRSDPQFASLAAQYTVGCTMPLTGDSSLLDPREIEAEFKKQEEVLKRFRTHECNLLIGPTGWALEDGGLELPRCNLVLRFDHESISTEIIPLSRNSNLKKLSEHSISKLEESIVEVFQPESVSSSEIKLSDKNEEKPSEDMVPRSDSECLKESPSASNEEKDLDCKVLELPCETEKSDAIVDEEHPSGTVDIKESCSVDGNKDGSKDDENCVVKSVVEIEVEVKEEEQVSSGTEESNISKEAEEVNSEIVQDDDNSPVLLEKVISRTPVSYHSYARSRARARAPDAHHIIMAAEGEDARRVVESLAHFIQVEEMLLRRCKNREPPEEEEVEADDAALQGEIYCPASISSSTLGVKTSQPSTQAKYQQHWSVVNNPTKDDATNEKACVTLATAISLVNRYCAKLPSDTFTRLTPLWSLKKVKGTDGDLSYICALRLPINSPVKQDILGHPMRSKALARRSAALEACKVLHQAKELDDDLMPVGKESFRAEVESDEEDDPEDEEEEDYEDESITENLTNKKHDSAEKDLSENEICNATTVLESTNDNPPESILGPEKDESLDMKETSEEAVSNDIPDELTELKEPEREKESIKIEEEGKVKKQEHKEEKDLDLGDVVNGEVDGELISPHCICQRSPKTMKGRKEKFLERVTKNLNDLEERSDIVTDSTEKSIHSVLDCIDKESESKQCNKCMVDRNNKILDKDSCDEKNLINLTPVKLPEEEKKPVDKKEMTLQENKLKGGKELKTKNKQQEVEYLEEEGEEEVAVGDGLSGMYSLDRPRPGTTKRRQYYYKRTADALTDCRPQPMFPAYLYNIGMNLVCPLPDEQNTRGRRIHPPEDSPRGFGILTLKEIPKICAFPIFTRSGEVRVCLEPSKPGVTLGKTWTNSSMLYSVFDDHKVKALPNGIKEFVLPDPQQILLTEEQLSKALAFLNYTFAGVLRLQRYLMAFDPVASENSYLIVPTMTRKITEREGNDEDSNENHANKEWIEVDWDFVDLIYECKGESKPAPVSQEERKSFQFDSSLYHDAVVMPWYRNQDQPQYFYVAEICTHLSPKSSFPGSEYKTFEEYYYKKYAIQICNREQPLLDVDHTSARLNFLTPRYVNRKGVALPTSSEETKRAKRESLEQKQILVPELCCRHPFPASLWRKAVCLPCILYRLNALLLADQLRARVAREIGVGLEKVPEDFEWPPLDFGWSLADVLKRSKEAENQNMEAKKGANPGKGEDKNDGKREDKISEDDSDDVDGEERKKAKKKGPKRKKRKKKKGEGSEDERSDEDDDTDDDSEKNEGEDWMEIGTWSNEMAMQAGDVPALPDNVTMVEEGGRDGWGKGSVGGRGERVRYGSPSIWKGSGAPVEVFSGLENDLEGLETTDSSGDDDDDDAPEDEEGVEEAVLIPEEEVEDRGHHPRGKLRIQFKNDYLAEAVEVLDEDIIVESQLKAVTEAGEEEEENEMTEDDEESSSWSLEEEFETPEKERVEEYIKRFENAVSNNRKMIENSGMLLQSEQKFTLSGKISKNFETQHLLRITSSSISGVLPAGVLDSPRKENDNTESARTNSNTEDYISIDSLSDDEDVFLDASSSSEDDDVDLHTEIVPREGSPCSSSSSICSCCSSCSSCSSPIWSSEEEALEIDLEEFSAYNSCESAEQNQSFSFDAQPTLEGHPGPSPTLLLQALTMSNANDGINLERLETIGDSFLKYAITAYLYCTHHSIHEGKLSHLRSKQVSNVNLYRLGRRKKLGESMIAAKFEPHDNWLPPCYHVPLHLERALIRAGLPPSHWNGAEVPSLASLSPAQIGRVVREKGRRMMMKSISEQDNPQGGSPTSRTPCLPHSNDGNVSSSYERSGRPDAQRALGRNSGKKLSNLDQELKNKLGDRRSNPVSGKEDSNLASSHNAAGEDRMEELPCFVPYNLVTQQSIPDKSVADCVEALIGAYLIACGPRGALLFMAWLGIRVLPSQKTIVHNPRDMCLNEKQERLVGCMAPKDTGVQKGDLQQVIYGALMAPPPPLALSSCAQSNGQEMQQPKKMLKNQDNLCKHCLRLKRKVSTSESGETIVSQTSYDLKKSNSCDKKKDNYVGIVGDGFEVSTSVKKELKALLGGLNEFEKHIGYYFRDRSLLLQALTHASYSPNRLTDCYQRLEFLGDAVLDYLITRHLYEDPRQHSPGALTDLRSALVNNTIFASLAVRHGFHRFFLHLSPGLHSVVERFVRMQASNGHAICEEYYLIEEEECEEAEDVEVPKALGDVFESVAGAIFLDSGMSLDAVWKVYYRMMKAEIEQFSTNVPKSPIRELLEMEPETAKFGKPEKLADGRRVRVTVEVFGKGTFKGIGRNYRIAKCTAAKCALRQLKKRGLLFPRKN